MQEPGVHPRYKRQRSEVPSEVTINPNLNDAEHPYYHTERAKKQKPITNVEVQDIQPTRQLTTAAVQPEDKVVWSFQTGRKKPNANYGGYKYSFLSHLRTNEVVYQCKPRQKHLGYSHKPCEGKIVICMDNLKVTIKKRHSHPPDEELLSKQATTSSRSKRARTPDVNTERDSGHGTLIDEEVAAVEPAHSEILSHIPSLEQVRGAAEQDKREGISAARFRRPNLNRSLPASKKSSSKKYRSGTPFPLKRKKPPREPTKPGISTFQFLTELTEKKQAKPWQRRKLANCCADCDSMDTPHCRRASHTQLKPTILPEPIVNPELVIEQPTKDLETLPFTSTAPSTDDVVNVAPINVNKRKQTRPKQLSMAQPLIVPDESQREPVAPQPLETEPGASEALSSLECPPSLVASLVETPIAEFKKPTENLFPPKLKKRRKRKDKFQKLTALYDETAQFLSRAASNMNVTELITRKSVKSISYEENSETKNTYDPINQVDYDQIIICTSKPNSLAATTSTQLALIPNQSESSGGELQREIQGIQQMSQQETAGSCSQIIPNPTTVNLELSANQATRNSCNDNPQTNPEKIMNPLDLVPGAGQPRTKKRKKKRSGQNDDGVSMCSGHKMVISKQKLTWVSQKDAVSYEDTIRADSVRRQLEQYIINSPPKKERAAYYKFQKSLAGTDLEIYLSSWKSLKKPLLALKKEMTKTKGSPGSVLSSVVPAIVTPDCSRNGDTRPAVSYDLSDEYSNITQVSPLPGVPGSPLFQTAAVLPVIDFSMASPLFSLPSPQSTGRRESVDRVVSELLPLTSFAEVAASARYPPPQATFQEDQRQNFLLSRSILQPQEPPRPEKRNAIDERHITLLSCINCQRRTELRERSCATSGVFPTAQTSLMSEAQKKRARTKEKGVECNAVADLPIDQTWQQMAAMVSELLAKTEALITAPSTSEQTRDRALEFISATSSKLQTFHENQTFMDEGSISPFYVLDLEMDPNELIVDEDFFNIVP